MDLGELMVRGDHNRGDTEHSPPHNRSVASGFDTGKSIFFKGREGESDVQGILRAAGGARHGHVLGQNGASPGPGRGMAGSGKRKMLIERSVSKDGFVFHMPASRTRMFG